GATVVPLDPHFAIASAAILVLTRINVMGVFVGKTVQHLLTVAKVVGLGSISVVGLSWYGPGAWEDPPRTPQASETFVPLLGRLAIILVMYAYGGWNDSAFAAAEVRNPRRNITLALFIGVGIITLVYVLVNAAYINSIGWANLGKSREPLTA